MLGAYWYLACEVLSKTARELAEHFQKVFHMKFYVLPNFYA